MSDPQIIEIDERLLKLVTRKRATKIAKALFRDEYHVHDCKDGPQGPGMPCLICSVQNEAWEARVDQVRLAVMDSFR